MKQNLLYFCCLWEEKKFIKYFLILIFSLYTFYFINGIIKKDLFIFKNFINSLINFLELISYIMVSICCYHVLYKNNYYNKTVKYYSYYKLMIEILFFIYRVIILIMTLYFNEFLGKYLDKINNTNLYSKLYSGDNLDYIIIFILIPLNLFGYWILFISFYFFKSVKKINKKSYIEKERNIDKIEIN